MGARLVSPALLQFVDDELLRAPLLFDQVAEGAIEQARKALPQMSPLQRSTVADLMQAVQAGKPRLCEYFMRSLREQVDAELNRTGPKKAATAAKPAAPLKLALVEEDEVALDVELSHTIEAINSVAEYELRELQTFVSAMVGDMDVATDHNPFRADTWARAVWAAAQALPLSRGHQVAFMRHACMPLAQLLRKSYAASSSRLEGMGIEPAAYRTLILPSGSRRGPRAGETTFSPDLHRIREAMPAPQSVPITYQGQRPEAPAPRREHWTEVAAAATNRGDRQSVELVSRLFDEMQADERVPDDVKRVISQLHGPAMRLTLRDGSMLDQDKHALWRFINRVVFEAEMAPDPADPERVLLLKNAHATVEQLSVEPEQNTGLYRWALDRLESYLHKRLTRRLSSASSQIGALQKLEDKLTAGNAPPSSFHGMLDVPQLDTVPADLMPEAAPAGPADGEADTWLESLRPGDWVRLFLQGRWVRARVLWPGERREVWLLGDGASDTTWAMRRGALRMLHVHRLAKTLRQRSIVGSAALRVQEKMADAQSAA